MPLRRWFSEHGHPSWYSWLVVVGGCLTTLIISVVINVRLDQTARERERASTEQGRQAFCLLINRMVQVYSDPGPSTQTGRNAAQAWKDLGRIAQCAKE